MEKQSPKKSKIYCAEEHKDCVVSFPYEITFKVGALLRIATDFFLQDSILEQLEERLISRSLGGFPLCSSGTKQERIDWKANGIDGEILETNGKTWRKGKVKMKIVLELEAKIKMIMI